MRCKLHRIKINLENEVRSRVASTLPPVSSASIVPRRIARSRSLLRRRRHKSIHPPLPRPPFEETEATCVSLSSNSMPAAVRALTFNRGNLHRLKTWSS